MIEGIGLSRYPSSDFLKDQTIRESCGEGKIQSNLLFGLIQSQNGPKIFNRLNRGVPVHTVSVNVETDLLSLMLVDCDWVFVPLLVRLLLPRSVP